MLLAIDVGNSAVKAGWYAEAGVCHEASLALADFLHDPGALLDRHPAKVAVVANVAGATAARRLQAWAAARGLRLEWVKARRAGYGLRNEYREPERLGADRWAAMVAARRRFDETALLLASVGTALTADVLLGDRFLGGIIVPGPESMARCVASSTAGVGTGEGQLEWFPRDTPCAVHTGVWLGCAAVIDRMVVEAGARFSAIPRLVLSGGGAGLLAPLLETPPTLVPGLVLEGLRIIAQEEGWG